MGIDALDTILSLAGSSPSERPLGSDGDGETGPPRHAIAERIREFLVERFPEVRARPPGVDDPLLDSGLLHSLGVLELVEFVESEYDVVFADDEVSADVFETLGSLAGFVRRKRSGEGSKAG